MRDMEREEALWNPENGAENREVKKECIAEAVELAVKEAEEPFEIPEIPATFSVPKESAPLKAAEPEPVWDLQAAKQKLKEAKKQYRLEKKRQHRGLALWLTGVLCTLLGGILGAVLTWFFLTR